MYVSQFDQVEIGQICLSLVMSTLYMDTLKLICIAQLASFWVIFLALLTKVLIVFYIGGDKFETRFLH